MVPTRSRCQHAEVQRLGSKATYSVSVSEEPSSPLVIGTVGRGSGSTPVDNNMFKNASGSSDSKVGHEVSANGKEGSLALFEDGAVFGLDDK